MRALAVTLAVAGCYNPTLHTGVRCGPGNVCPGEQQCIDGYCGGTTGMDGRLDDDATDGKTTDGQQVACETWTPVHFDACSIPQSPGNLILDDTSGSYSFDTDTGELRKMGNTIPVLTMTMTQAGGPTIMLMSVNNFTVAAGVDFNITGSRPVLIAAWGTATIAGTVDASANFSAVGPSGGVNCTGSTGTTGVAGAPATGGGGGSFQGTGGRGGNTGGVPGATIAISSIIRGGCSGGQGPAGQATALRGGGGGAIQITARQSITISATGSINASGGGGAGGSYNVTTFATGGAGGGGSGGYIGLDAAMVSVSSGGKLAANGGAGGGGSSDAGNGSSGNNGRDDNISATGGPGSTVGLLGACVPGGNGAAAAPLNGFPAGTSGCGGSGGGGGAGYIYVWASSYTSTGTVSPPKTTGP